MLVDGWHKSDLRLFVIHIDARAVFLISSNIGLIDAPIPLATWIQSCKELLGRILG